MQELIECKVCGVSFKVLGKHLGTHDMTIWDYLEKYPEAPTHSEEYSKNLSTSLVEFSVKNPNARSENAQKVWTYEKRREQSSILFDIWAKKTPEERVNFSQSMKQVRLNKTSEELEEWIKNAAEGSRDGWSKKTPEEMKEFCEIVKEIHSNRALKDRLKINEKISKAVLSQQVDVTKEVKEERNKRRSKTFSSNWEKKSFEEWKAWRDKCSITQTLVWARLSEKERDTWVQNAVRGQKRKPSIPEVLLWDYLERNFPGVWLYNGGSQLGIVIGRKIPDFIRADKSKEVIELLGGIGFFHSLADEEVKIRHYLGYSHKCIIVWEWDCYIPGELDKIFKKV